MSTAIDTILNAMNRKPSVAQSFYGHCSEMVEVWKVDDKKLGCMMRKIRIAQSVSLRAHARKLNWSAPYVSDLELGRRGWTIVRVELYLKALPQMPEPLSLQIRRAGKTPLTMKALKEMGITPQETVLA